jgi:hypothetical protein
MRRGPTRRLRVALGISRSPLALEPIVDQSLDGANRRVTPAAAHPNDLQVAHLSLDQGSVKAHTIAPARWEK